MSMTPDRPDPGTEVNDRTWVAVDDYFDEALVHDDEALKDVQRVSTASGLPPISVSGAQGKLLHLLARSIGARHILEIGTLGGYSTVWLARALRAPGGLITLELDPHHAQVARSNLDRAGVGELVEIRVGPAAQSLEALVEERLEPFDFVFVDADKASNATYFEYAVRLSRPGTVIVVDNVVRGGHVIDHASRDEDVQGVRRLVDALAANRKVAATAIQTVGSKGYDGLIVALVGEK
jgi:predicted O-methyltransferase YrrM